VGRPEGKRELGRPTIRCDYNIIMIFQELVWGH
jgi:hypothetical protein